MIVDADGMPMVFSIDSQNPYVRITLDGSPDLIGIVSLFTSTRKKEKTNKQQQNIIVFFF